MRRLFVVIACILVSTVPVEAQSTRISGPRGVPGIIDPMTGQFKAVAPRAVDALGVALVSGRIVYQYVR